MGIKFPPFYGEHEAFYIDECSKALNRIENALKNDKPEVAVGDIRYLAKCAEILLENISKVGK